MPHRLESPSGLTVQVNDNGSIRRIDHGDVVVNLFLGSEIEGGPANVFLRRRGAAITSTPLLGPASPGTISIDGGRLVVRGEWQAIRFELVLVLAASAPAWLWHLRLANVGSAPATVDAVYAQDLALAPYGAIRLNEYYVSQYVDYVPLVHPERGFVLAVRQNLAQDGRHPWALVGTLGHAVGFATDALELHGLATRAGGVPEALRAPALPVARRQHEHSMAVIQDAQVVLAPGAEAARGFFGWLEADHPGVTTEADLAVMDRVAALAEATPPPPVDAPAASVRPAATLFSTAPILACHDLDDAALARHFGTERRHVETEQGRLLSFFTGRHEHVVLHAKEHAALRPHGHLLRSGDHLVPDEAALTSTAWMNGVFHSMITQGHVSINRMLSTTRSYLGLLRAPGLRIFIEMDGGWHLLGVPSAFAMTPSSCRWLYAHAGGVVAIESRAVLARHELTLALRVLAGAPCRFLLSHHVALAGDDGAEAVPVRWERDATGIVVRTHPETDLGARFPDGFFRIDPGAGTTIERVAGDEALFLDARSRAQPFLAVVTGPTTSASFSLTARLTEDALPTAAPAALDDEGIRADAFWSDVSGVVAIHPPPDAAEIGRVQDILPWFAQNALVHYLAPRGLEQYSGGGWGTRDVCQGPVELLLALGRFGPVRDILLRVFAAQNPDGDWPQWFGFFPRDRLSRAGDSHGDIVFWPLLALGQYLLASDDGALLDVALPFFAADEADGGAEPVKIASHVGRALGVIEGRQIPDTSLVAYGHGDWNDSLQPVDPAMRERLCSSWTVTLQVQTAHTLAAAFHRFGWDALAIKLDALAARTRQDFQRLLIPGGTLAGFAHFHAHDRIEYLLHPSDRTTGIHYRLLPMIHALINGMLTPEQARTHVELIRTQLLAPDGARLFDRPPQYRGGEQRAFQRAESSTYFGREIGIMYVHAHLRYAEAMATVGEAEAFYLALRQMIPIGVTEVVPNARRRQANCYASSSDAAFRDRYEAQARYDEVKQGTVPVDGGWRVYSSGAGIAFRLIHERLFGLCRRHATVTIDPVLPRRLDGLALDVTLAGRPVRITYHVGAQGFGPSRIVLNGGELDFEREPNPYRLGGAVVATADLATRLRAAENELDIHLG